MGSLSSVIAPIANIGVKTIASAGQYYVANSERFRDMDTLNAKNTQLAQSAALQKQSNLLALQQKETDRQSKLRRALSTQRANFGSQGVGSVTGSSDSVLQGLNESSDIERQNNQAKTSLDNTIIDQNLNYQTQLNLLQKQQLKQKAALGFVTDLIG
jgi:hypothetical protein